MINDFKKSIDSILYERVTSPFWGAIIISWIVCNWKIIYLTFFVSEDSIQLNKLEYINQNLNPNFYSLLVLPLLVTAFVLLILPFISNRIYWIHLRFRNWKVLKKREVEQTITLSMKESLEIRSELLKQEEKIQKLNMQKDQRIVELNKQLNDLQGVSDNLRDENIAIKTENSKLINQRNQVQEREDYTKVFSGDWSYNINDSEKLFFQTLDKNQMEFRTNDKSKKYFITTIDRYRNWQFLILLRSEKGRSHKEAFDFKLVSLMRSKDNIDTYEGLEMSYIKDKNGKTHANFNSLELKPI